MSELLYPSGAHSDRGYNDLGELTSSILYAPSGLTLDEHDYDYNSGLQRTKQTFRNGNFVNYGYDNIGQLTSAAGFELGGTPRSHEQFGYGYDKAWNSNYRTNNALVENFSANAANELSSVGRSGTLTVAGTSTERPAAYPGDYGVTNVTVSGSTLSSGPADLYADGTWARPNVTLANGANNYTATAHDYAGRTSQDTVSANLPTSSSFTYDPNGNLLSDGTRNFSYNDENELTSVWVTNAWRSDFFYDGMMRRRIRREYTWISGAWTPTNEVHYVYDRMLVLQERYFDQQLSTVISEQNVTYTRGLDLDSFPTRGRRSRRGVGPRRSRRGVGPQKCPFSKPYAESPLAVRRKHSTQPPAFPPGCPPSFLRSFAVHSHH